IPAAHRDVRERHLAPAGARALPEGAREKRRLPEGSFGAVVVAELAEREPEVQKTCPRPAAVAHRAFGDERPFERRARLVEPHPIERDDAAVVMDARELLVVLQASLAKALGRPRERVVRTAPVRGLEA